MIDRTKGYETVGVMQNLGGWLDCRDCGEPVLRIEQGEGVTLACTRCGWSVRASSTTLVHGGLKNRTVEFPRPSMNGNPHD